MKIGVLAVLPFLVFSATGADAGEEFGIEDALGNWTDIPVLVAADVEKGLADGGKCLADARTTAKDALEAADIDLGSSRALLLKPKMPSESKAAWGCFCGAYACPIWIYSFEGTSVHLLWSSSGGSLEIVGHKDKGMKRLLLTSGSAGHQEMAVYAWNGRDYVTLREKSVQFGLGNDLDAQTEKDLAEFRSDAAR